MNRFFSVKDNYHASEATLQEFDTANAPKINEMQKVRIKKRELLQRIRFLIRIFHLTAKRGDRESNESKCTQENA
jgi:hypothetical protein